MTPTTPPRLTVELPQGGTVTLLWPWPEWAVRLAGVDGDEVGRGQIGGEDD